MKIVYIHKDDWIEDKNKRRTVRLSFIVLRLRLLLSYFNSYFVGDRHGSSGELRSRRNGEVV